MKVKKMIAGIIKVVLGFMTLAFLGLKSYQFFVFITPADQWYYALLGFGLTGLAALGYLALFMWDADTPTKKTVSIVMIFVCLLGEIATAGFGLQIQAWHNSGYILDQENFNFMIIVVQALGFVHALAFIAYFAGDQLAEAFRDEDGDGIPNAFDKDYRRKQKTVYASEMKLVNKEENPTNPPRKE